MSWLTISFCQSSTAALGMTHMLTPLKLLMSLRHGC